MKGLMVFALLWVVGVMLACTGSAPGTAPLPASLKGYELYSWQEGSEWHFTLVTGTNRAKNADELTTGGSTISSDWVDIQVAGEEAILEVLRRLPAGTFVSWPGAPNCGQHKGVVFAFPPQSVVDAVAAQVRAQGATFYPPVE